MGSVAVTKGDALVPTVLAGTAIAELPNSSPGNFWQTASCKTILADWTLPRGALYFVTPSSRARPAKVEALAAFFVERLSKPGWPRVA